MNENYIPDNCAKPSPTVSQKDDKENPSKTVSKAKEIIDGKFLEDYFYNS